MTSTAGYDDSPLLAAAYDHVVPYRERPDVGFYVERARRSGGPVLEAGCGTGRILIPTARAGIAIVGLDSSTEMLRVCRARLAGEPEEVRSRVELVQGDMRTFELERRFALATMPFRSFQHLLTVEDQLACLARVQRHLEPDGRLIVDLFNPSLAMLSADNLGQEFGEEPDFDLPDGRRVRRRFRLVAKDPIRQVNEIELLYYLSGPEGRSETVVHAFAMRYLFRFEAEHLLARAGFELEAVLGDYAGSPFCAEHAMELVLVARRAG